MARLKDQYINEIAPALNKKFGYKSVMQIPKLDKVVINVACGEAKENEKILESVMKDLAQITGQKAVICRAKKSVANFKLRAGTPTAAATLPAASRSRSSSPRSTSTRSTPSAAWMSALSPPPRPTKRARSC